MTDHVLSFLSAYQGALTQAFSLPDELSRDYALYDCLRESPEKSTYLVRNQADGSLALLKVATGKYRDLLHAEYDILNSLHSALFPRAICYFSDSDTTYFLRAHVAGTPVSDYVELHGPFSEAEAVRLCAGLCDALQLLHAQTPPVIHRDIKPQNVIFTKERTLSLIDFDAARRYQSEQKRDTVFLGTQATAAPEQFGYQQTDQRSDIYSTGILLLFLCTGSYELESLPKVQSRGIRRLILTATRFDPRKRYASAQQLRAELLRQSRLLARPSGSFFGGLALGLSLSIVLFTGAYLLGGIEKQAEKHLPSPSSALQAATVATETPITFDSPALEEVVRQKLGVDESTPLYQEDLDSITSIYLFGTTLLNSWSDVVNKTQYNKPNQAGTINTLSDLPKLRNLTELSLSYQSISDLSPLEGSRLIRLALNGNLIKDLTPISSMPDLQELLVGQNPIYQVDALASCTTLQVVDLDDTYVVDISPLNTEMKRVLLSNTPVVDYSPLLKMKSLRDVFLSSLNQSDLSILSQLTGLTTLVLTDSTTSMKPILTLKNLKSLALNDTRLTSIDGIETLERLTYFRVFTENDIDLTPLTKLPRLGWLDIYKQPLSDYSFLFRIASLKTLYCTKEQKEEIDSFNHTQSFKIIILD